MSTIETRVIYEAGKLSIVASTHEEDTYYEDLLPDWDDAKGREAIEDMRRNIDAGNLDYVGIVVRVFWDNAEIAEDSLWGIAAGLVGQDTEGHDINADPWEVIHARYDGNTIIGGSQLIQVADEAISNAAKWAEANGSAEMREALRVAARWADPNNPDYRDDEAVTTVIFRKWYKAQDGTGVIALFPDVPGDGPMCQSYEHVGQHGSADAAGVISRTKPATPEEYAALKRELEAAPYHYRLKVVRRMPHKAHR